MSEKVFIFVQHNKQITVTLFSDFVCLSLTEQNNSYSVCVSQESTGII